MAQECSRRSCDPPTHERRRSRWLGYVFIGLSWTCAAFLSMPHAPRLALLRACASWIGPQRPGNGGAGHLASSLFRRGTSTVVLPAASVSAAATHEWNRVLRWSLSQGDSPARAAREARQVLAASSDYSDPFFYALLHVVGVGHESLFPDAKPRDPDTKPASAERASSLWLWILAGAGMVILVATIRQR
jgi:hypothetical protein